MHQPIVGDPDSSPDTPRWRTIRHFAYVDRPFRDVRRCVAAAPQRILADPPGPSGGGGAPTAELHVRRAGLDLGRNVRMVIDDIVVGVHSARLPLTWEDATRPGLFPILDATLEFTPVRAGRHDMTQLGLFGRYRPPFGRLGGLGDTVGGHRIVVESVDRFLDDLVGRFHAALPPAPPSDREDGGGDWDPGSGRRRIVLPVAGLDRLAGGAAGLGMRLLGEPGVLDASVNPRTGLAVVDYDGAACNLGRLVELVDPEP